MAVKKAPRRAERSLAFQVLYSLTFTPATNVQDVAKAFRKAPEQGEPVEKTGALEGFAWELVEGVWTNMDTIDAHLAAFSQNWRIERMGKVEITLLRLALYEILYRHDVPPKVAINEAIELSKQFGDDGSRGFVNGILDAAAKAVESGKLQRQ
ncbi:transcription antitermination protein [uncultured delta proteobacterium]|uniref:Transcription antitermination protein NusB n=1 Tax=uncultured delta proteobacterium TaxID=34034 RepID=A0A212JER1_9DELT|nr:transcription antitermination protein [uncultured delta proteobacterium]